MRVPGFRTLLVAWAASAVTSTYALRLAAEPTPAGAAVTPPRLLQAPAVEPPLGEAPREPVSVELELTVDASGRVSSARVTRSGGADFDEKALSAARGFEFEPARRGDEPVAVTIGYRYVFPAAAAPDASTEPPPAATSVAPPPPSASAASAPRTPAPSPELETFEATAEVEAPPRETTKRSIPG